MTVRFATSAALRPFAFLLAAAVGCAAAQSPAPQAVTPPAPQCASVVVVKCDPPAADAAGSGARQDAARRMDARRTAQATQEMDRVIIEGDSERRSPEDTINRALARPLVKRGETTFPIGEGAQCTCLNICPPWPLPCCACSGQTGSRHATAPGWKPTD
jgi:hypothetical protein